MSTLCTPRDVLAALSPDGVINQESAASLPPWQIEDSILEAEATVASYLSSVYTIPSEQIEVENPVNPNEPFVFTVAPSPVRGWTRNIAAWLATLVYRKSKDVGEDDPIRLRYDMTMTALKDAMNGITRLPLPPVGHASSGALVVNLYEGTLFGPEDFGIGPADSYPMVQRIIRARPDIF